MSHETSVQPKLGDLLARYLAKQADAHDLGTVPVEAEVTPYEAGPVQPIDPKLAWDEAQAVLPHYGQVDSKRRVAPPQWSNLVANHEPMVALAFGLGNFPQLVRNLHLLFENKNLSEHKPSAGRATPADSLLAWADETASKKHFPQVLLALGALRLAKQFAAAEAFIQKNEAIVTEEWKSAWENEKAALAWHMGRCEEARAAWQAMEPTTPVLFNRGMADLFLGQPAAARVNLTAALAKIPEASAWHHLGRLYITLSQMRG